MSSIEAFDSADTDRFVVHLVRGRDESVTVTHVELTHADIRNRYTFKQGRSLSEVFSDSLAAALTKALNKMGPGKGIVSIPDFNLTLPGLVLGGLRILCKRAADGVNDLIMVRVREYVGSIKSAFRFDPSLAVDSASMRERVAVEVLRDIVNPLLDILSISRDAPADVIDNNTAAIRRQLERMSVRQDEINFYISLLHRYIAGCRSDAEKQVSNGADRSNVTTMSPL
ncbi:MAG: hypothetical protein AAGA08_10710 [Pseudomonadota bacterium]